MKIAIVDDCLGDSRLLADLIQRYCQETFLVLEMSLFSSGEKFINSLHSAAEYDIIFLDIYMDGMDGMETARRLRERHTTALLIFATSSTSHAIESYRVRAFDYLTKPYDYEQLREVLRLCDDTLFRKTRYIQVKEGRLMIKILLRDILYTDYYNHYIQIHTRARMIRSYMPFSEFSQLLLPYPQFLCCYRNCIVNLDAVLEIDEQDFIVEGGVRVPMARAQRTELRQRYADYAFSRLDEGV